MKLLLVAWYEMAVEDFPVRFVYVKQLLVLYS